MKAKVIYLAGVPASGKSTLFRMIRERLFAEACEFRSGKCKGIESKCGKYRMLGVFDGSTFEGTDKLSMTVIDDAINYIKGIDSKAVVFVEGDRLFNYRFLRETQAMLLLIDANERILRARHIQRGDDQTERFLRSRRTKVENFIDKYHVPRIWNNTQQDQERIFNFIISSAEKYVERDELR